MPHYYTIKSVLKKPIKMPALVAYIKFFLLFMSVHLFCKFKFTYLLKVSLPSWILYLFILSLPCLSFFLSSVSMVIQTELLHVIMANFGWLSTWQTWEEETSVKDCLHQIDPWACLWAFPKLLIPVGWSSPPWAAPSPDKRAWAE